MVFEGRTQPALLVLVFAAVCVMSAMALVYTKHEARKLFVELEGLSHERDELNIEWGQLQIEQSTWATHARRSHWTGCRWYGPNQPKYLSSNVHEARS